MNFIRRFINSSPEKRNIYHPNYRDKVEKAFNLSGINYYRFKDPLDTPHYRNFYSDLFIDQYRRGVSNEVLLSYLDEFDKHGNKGQIGDLMMKVRLLRERIQANQQLDLLYRIATVCYFTDEEDLETYSIPDNKHKLEVFTQSKDLSFFLTSPMTDIFPLLSGFVSDSEVFLSRVQLAKELTEQIDLLVFSPSGKE
jgi:hypothetical protein